MSGRYADGLHIDYAAMIDVLEMPEGASPPTRTLAEIGQSLAAFYGPRPKWHFEVANQVIQYASEVASQVECAGSELPFDFHILFNLARRLQSSGPVSARRSPEVRDSLTPYAVLFVHCLRLLEVLPLHGADRIEWHIDEDVELEWESAWGKVKYAEGETLVERTRDLARERLITFSKHVKGETYLLFLTYAYYLQLERGEGNDILLPIHTVADQICCTHQTASNLIGKAIREEFLTCVDPSYRPGKAKRFRFDLRHPHLKEKKRVRP